MADTVATNSILPFHYCNSRSFVFSRKWLVETELADTLEEQYFIAQTAGKSWPKGEAKIAKNFGQKCRYLAILSKDFAEKRPKWR